MVSWLPCFQYKLIKRIFIYPVKKANAKYKEVKNAFIYPCPNCITLMMILWHQPWISLLFPSRVVKFVYKRNVDDLVYIYSYIISFHPLCYPGKVRIVNFLSFCNADTDIFTVNFTRLFCSLFASSILQSSFKQNNNRHKSSMCIAVCTFWLCQRLCISEICLLMKILMLNFVDIIIVTLSWMVSL